MASVSGPACFNQAHAWLLRSVSFIFFQECHFEIFKCMSESHNNFTNLN